ncbi:MAG: SUMF1/EgtB/PvdO family nonheme iron enzyme, partial [Geminicoccaceae bacterium]
MPTKPDAFLSYTRFDDEEGEITAFRQRLSRTVRQVSGEPFNIFQDVDDQEGIGLGERWKDKLDEMLDQARFFIPILTPSFFRSEPCKQELRTFLDLERKVGRRDLVLPIYWIACPVLEEGHLKAKDELAQEIDDRQRWDWRELLFEELTSPACRRELHALSTQIERARRNVLRVVETAEPARVGEPTRTSTQPSKPTQARKPEPKPSKPKSVAKKSRPEPTLWTPGEVFRDIDEPWCPEMVKIPAGTFAMGSPKSEKGRWHNEGPQHEVTISKDFAIGRYPVTFKEYDQILLAKCSYFGNALCKIGDHTLKRRGRRFMSLIVEPIQPVPEE